MNRNKLYLVGDQMLPTMCGANGKCVPTTRVTNASFEHLRQALEAQRKLGWSPEKGTVFCVALHTFLWSTTPDLYWSQLGDFARWIADEFGGDVMPVIPLYPEGMRHDSLIKHQQFVTGLMGRHVGNLQVPEEWRFSGWIPYSETMQECGASKISLEVPAVHIMAKGAQIFECEKEVFAGIQGDFSEGLPSEPESIFLKNLFSHLKKAVPAGRNIDPPDIEAIEHGVQGGALFLHRISQILPPFT